jgi:hypothetical protein
LHRLNDMPPKTQPIGKYPYPSTVDIQPSSPVRRYILLIVLVVMAITASYLLISKFGFKSTSPSPIDTGRVQVPASQPDANLTTVDRVKRLIYVTSDKQPTVWTITNLDLVKPQNPILFKDAELGDYLVAWADKAVVYSPGKDRIVGMLMTAPGKDATIPEPPQATSTAAAPTPEQPASTTEPATPTVPTVVHVEIRNASGITGAAKKLKAKLVADGLAVDGVGDAALKRDGTIVVDLTGGSAPDAVSKVASETGGTVVTAVPDGEPASTSGILVLIGR